MKTCSKCNITKDFSSFQKRNTKNGYRGVCKTCRNSAAKSRYSKDQRRDWHLRSTYGITLSEFNDLAAEQGNFCANPSCFSLPEVVDHNHNTGTVRGLLCNGCNTAAGLAKDNPEILEGLALYLKTKGHYG